MIIVKITILLALLWVIYGALIRAYLEGNLQEALKVQLTKYTPWYLFINGILTLCVMLCIIASVVYLLFFR